MAKKTRVFYETMLDTSSSKEKPRKRLYENFDSFEGAERSARALLRWNNGRIVHITRIMDSFTHREREACAVVRADALGRIWTDSLRHDGLI